MTEKLMVVVHCDRTAIRAKAVPVALPVRGIKSIEPASGLFLGGRNRALITMKDGETYTIIETVAEVADLCNGDIDPESVEWKKEERRVERERKDAEERERWERANRRPRGATP